MRFAAGPPSKWVVTLRSGAVVELAADLYSERDGRVLFSILADMTPDERREVRLVDAQPGMVVVASVPMSEVATIEGGWSWSEDPGGD